MGDSNEHSPATSANLLGDIRNIIQQAQSQVAQTVNTAMVRAYWLIGKRIVDDEQNGKSRAAYGKQVLSKLSQELTQEFGKGFSTPSLKNFRQFYLTFPEFSLDDASNAKSATAWSLLSWSHYKRLMRVSDPNARQWYISETANNAWSVRTLDRNITTQYYQRLLASQLPEPVEAEMQAATANLQHERVAFIKNPSVLEFLNLPQHASLTEASIETAIIDNLHHFLLELGKGFAFVERQQRIHTEANDYYIDLVFYNYILKCFVLIDLKTERISHQDVGQMDMYVRMYDETIKGHDDNPTVGIVLCSETDQDIARYSILKGNEQIFASKYKLYLPSEAELAAEIEREKELIRLQLLQEEQS